MESFGREDSGFLREAAEAVSLLFWGGAGKRKSLSEISIGVYN